MNKASLRKVALPEECVATLMIGDVSVFARKRTFEPIAIFFHASIAEVAGKALSCVTFTRVVPKTPACPRNQLSATGNSKGAILNSRRSLGSPLNESRKVPSHVIFLL